MEIPELVLKGHSACWCFKTIVGAVKAVKCHTYRYREAADRLWRPRACPRRSGLQPCRAPASPPSLHRRSRSTTETKAAIIDGVRTKTVLPPVSALARIHTCTPWSSFSMEAVLHRDLETDNPRLILWGSIVYQPGHVAFPLKAGIIILAS